MSDHGGEPKKEEKMYVCITMHAVGLGSQSKTSMIFSASSGGGKTVFTWSNLLPRTLDMPCSSRRQTMVDFSFRLHAVTGKDSEVSLTSLEASGAIGTL